MGIALTSAASVPPHVAMLPFPTLAQKGCWHRSARAAKHQRQFGEAELLRHQPERPVQGLRVVASRGGHMKAGTDRKYTVEFRDSAHTLLDKTGGLHTAAGGAECTPITEPPKPPSGPDARKENQLCL